MAREEGDHDAMNTPSWKTFIRIYSMQVNHGKYGGFLWLKYEYLNPSLTHLKPLKKAVDHDQSLG